MKALLRGSLIGLSALSTGLVGCGAATGSDQEETLGVTYDKVGGSLPGFVTSIKPYVVPLTTEYALQALLSVGDRVPRTADITQEYQMVGIPDGIGAYRAETDETVVYFNHEFGNTVTSEPIIGQPLNRGAIVSKIILDDEGRVTSGDRAYATVWNENTLVGPAADVGNTTPGFTRFCSGSLEYKDAGFDRPIYFAGEEGGGAATFDGTGGLAVAIFDNELHTLPKFGRFPWENTLAQPKKGERTVLLGMEDGPTTPDNQLYMYIGTKDRKKGTSPMRRNGLDNGLMYAFVSDTPGMTTELTFTSGSIVGHWVQIPNPETLSDVQLEVAADAIGAFGFIRTEDAAFHPTNPDIVYFVSTGSGPGNQLGRLYKMTLDPSNPVGNTTIELITNADVLAAGGVDTAISPDNVGLSADYLMINEDGTTPSRARMEVLGREASIWRFDIKNGHTADRIAELNPPARDAVDVPTSGTWETTGIIPIKGFKKDAWLVNVQAHSPTTAPAANTVEDGQLLLMRRTQFDKLLSD